ncbi:TPA: HAD hydrolase family protein [Staphylococcus aureus]|nr:HAD hydrolase family protein [Staphylococcus aureus]HEI6550023.1 HAD hydrolase family protein [Staphylococcus aureus]
MRFVFDIDGTLCFDGRLIDQTIIDTLLQLQHDGHELIFASARPIRDLLPVLPSVFHQHTLIGANGAMISQQSKISVEYNIDITAQNINKYTALQYIFDADVKYIAFGNDHNDIFMLQHASSGYIIGPSEAYTHAILKLDKIKHINNNTQAICKVLKSYK